MSLILTQEERVKTYGFECHGPTGEGILFKASTWRPGGEYIQKLIVKNVSSKVKKFKYKLPSSRYFSLAYPEEIILSPGIHKEIDVIFRPVEYEPYDDTIYIKILDGVAGHGFHVSVRATIDKLILRAPESLDLGFCTTHQITTIKFMLTNDGEVDAPFVWDSPSPFRLDPAMGTIPVGGQEEITVTIMPEDASVYASHAICHVGTGVHAIIPEPIIRTKLSAKAKYAHIMLSEGEVTFHEVVSGVSAAHRKLTLRNTSVVPAEFTLVRFDSDRDEIFGVYPKAGVVPPLGEVEVTITYTALAMGCYSLDRYAFRTPGGCNAVLTCKATAVPPKITLCKEVAAKVSKFGEPNSDEGTIVINGTKFKEAAPEFSLNFRDVEVGNVETRLLYLRNDSIRDTPFSVIADELGMFQMFPKQGIIPAGYKQYPIKVIFAPSKPINYYRRFFILIGDSLPLFYDCLGTGYIRAKGEIREQRPAPLRHAHVQAYRNRSVQGMGGLSPDELDRIYDESEPSPYFAQVGKIGTRALSVAAMQRPITRTGESVRTQVAPAHEFFISDTDMSSREITLNRTTLNFGYTSHNRVSAVKTVVMTNNTNSKVVVEWQVPIAGGLTLKDTQTMRGTDTRDKDLISADRAERERAVLQAFEIAPHTADINPGQSFTFEVTFVPKQTNRNYTSELEAFVFFKNQRTFRLVNDYSLTPPFCLTVSNIGHTFSTGQLLAKAQLLGGCVKGGKLVFPCTYVGETVYQTFMLRNTSNLPCTFIVELGWEGQDKTQHDELFSVKPSMGEIAAEDFTLVCVRFSPTATRKYLQLLRLFINGDEGGKLMLEGAGATPYLTLPDLQTTTSAGTILEGEQLDGQILSHIQQQEFIWGVAGRAPHIPRGPMGSFYLKPTCIGLSNSRPFQLKNASRLPLRYKVSLNAAAAGIALVTPKSGLLLGNEVTELSISFAPRKAEMYEFVLTISVYPIGGKTLPVKDANQPGPEAAPELLQTMTVRVLGQGETSALVFDPSRTTAAVRLVNTSEERAIYLDNISDSDLSYQLLYKEEFEPDAASLDPTRTISDVVPLVPHVAFGSMDAVLAAQTGVQTMEHSLFCEKPQGVLPARSRTRVLFTYQPRKAGLFEFLIYAQIQAVDRVTLQPVMISNDEAALLRLSNEDRQFGADGSALPPMASTIAMLPLMSNITARAAFPKLLFEDIRTESDLQISDVDALWKRFSLGPLNYDLSIPMTQREVQLNESSSPNLSELTTYKFEFMPAVQHSPVQTLVLQLRNNGYLTTEFHAHLPNEKKLELEAWCDEEKPSEELNRLVCIIEELKLFTFTPTHAVLQPGESCTLTISYKHSSLKYHGLHNLPIQIQLSQGKQFFLDLVGRTLPPPHPTPTTAAGNRTKPSTAMSYHSLHSAQSAAVSTANSATTRAAVGSGQVVPSFAHLPDFLLVVNAEQGSLVRLLPVPLGLSSALAPLQRIELINVSGVGIQYDVESLSIDQFIEENFHTPLVRIVNPTGFVPSQSSTFLEIHFFPLENKIYEFPLKIRYTNAYSPGLLMDGKVFPFADMPLPPATANMTSTSAAVSILTSNNRSVKSARGGPTSRAGTALPGSATTTAVAPPPPVPQYLNLVVQAPAYDPRDAKPVLLESLYAGGLAPAQPLLTLPTQKLTLSEDYLDFKVVPQGCTAKRITILRNTSATAAFEFVVDESSCLLCLDGLMSVYPLVGKLEPLDSIVLEFTFASYAQSMAFTERMKIMVREIIKHSVNKKSGMREALMKKIANKKTVSVDHDSVVARPTYARTMQIEQTPLPEHLHATLPSTINAKGVTIANVVHPELRHRDDANNHGFNASQGGGELGSFLVGDFGEISSPNSLHSRARPPASRVMEIDVPGSRSRAPGGINGNGVGFTSQPNSPDRGLTSKSQISNLGDRPGTTRDGSMTSGSRAAGAGGGGSSSATQQVSLGAPTVLIVRLRGDVYPLETTKVILQRNPQLDIMSEFVVPENPAFVPPVGQKFFDPVYLEAQKVLHSRGKVNFSLIKQRDAELREITHVVADALFRDLLNASSMQDYCRATLSGVNPVAVEIPESSYGRTSLPANNAAMGVQRGSESGGGGAEGTGVMKQPLFLADNVSYGVYFHEISIANTRPLLERLVIEWKHSGIMNVDEFTLPPASLLLDPSGGAMDANVQPSTTETETGGRHHPNHNPFSGMVPDPWTIAGEDILAARAETVAFPFQLLSALLNVLDISSAHQEPAEVGMYEAILQIADEIAVTHTNGSTADLLESLDTARTALSGVSTTPSMANLRAQSIIASMNRMVCVAVLLRRLNSAQRAFVDRKVCRAADARRRREAESGQFLSLGGGGGGSVGGEGSNYLESMSKVDGGGEGYEGYAGGSSLLVDTLLLTPRVMEVLDPVPTPVPEGQSHLDEHGALVLPDHCAQLLMRQQIGFASLAGEVLSGVLRELMQDLLTEESMTK